MHTSPKNYKQLQPEDRMIIASLREQNFSMQRIAGVLERTPATFGRELKRNTEQGAYASDSAQKHSQAELQLQPPGHKLHPQSDLYRMVRTLLFRAGCQSKSP